MLAMDDRIKSALQGRDVVIDITTIGRRSGAPRRIEIWFHNIDGRIIITGKPGPRNWLANLIANVTKSQFEQVSGVASGVADLRRVAKEARERLGMSGQRTVLFIDEIHRFNKAQQDVILPYVEDGTLVLIGATTENPSFEVVSPLLSRARVFALKSLTDEQVEQIIHAAMTDSELLAQGVRLQIGWCPPSSKVRTRRMSQQISHPKTRR